MIALTDQIGNKINLNQVPKRMVSLVPSQTELLVDLGLEEKVVGITKFCVHPRDLKNHKTIVGGTKQVHFDKIKALNPDIILCNKEENTKEMVIALKKIAPVHVSDITSLKDTYALIAQYGALFNTIEKGQNLINNIKSKAKSFKNEIIISPKKCIYLIWQKPYMAAGQGTFINHLLALNGLENSISEERYPEISLALLKKTDFVLLSSEPFPFSEKHIREIRGLTTAKVILVDGEYFSWYGSRLLKAFDYFKHLQTKLRES
jgi:ABC-type Fe3+-hydroxamate transport system substrate-binding protein